MSKVWICGLTRKSIILTQLCQIFRPYILPSSDKENYNYFREWFFLLLFYVRPSDFLQSRLRSDMPWGINHDIVVGPCSELFMRLFYCIHRIYGLEFLTLVGFEPGPSRTVVVYSDHSTKALTQYFRECYEISKKAMYY